VHVITKILVVAAAVFAVLLAGLTMAFSLNADTIVSDYLGEVRLRDAAVANLSAAQSLHAEERGELQKQLQAQQSELASRDQRIIQLEAEVAQLRTDKRDAEIAAERIANQIGQSLETTRVQAQMIDAYRQEIAKLRDQELVSRSQMIQLEDALNDLESQNEVLQQTARALQEQLKELETATASGVVEDGGLASAGFGTLRTIKGRVVAVRAETGSGETLVEVDVGENDGIEEGMILAAYRGRDTYLANIEIIRTDLQASVGRVLYYADGVDGLRPDDRVATNLR
jgi:hypothetical protein